MNVSTTPRADITPIPQSGNDVGRGCAPAGYGAVGRLGARALLKSRCRTARLDCIMRAIRRSRLARAGALAGGEAEALTARSSTAVHRAGAGLALDGAVARTNPKPVLGQRRGHVVSFLPDPVARAIRFGW